MKILIVGCKDYPAFSTPWVHSGGMEVYVERMVRSLADRAGFTLLTAGGASDAAAEVVPLGAARGLRTQPLSLLIRSLRRILAERPDVDVVNAQSPLSGFAGLVAARRWKIPYVVTVHIFGDEPAHAGSPPAAVLYSRLESLVLRRAAAIIPTGRALGGVLASRYPTIRSRIEVVTSAGTGIVATENRAEIRARLGLSRDDPVLLFLGRIVPENGLQDLLDAVALLRQEHPRACLLIAGAGEAAETGRMRARIRGNGLDGTVRWLGPLRGAEKLDTTAAADLLVRTSVHEVFPEAYIEALSVGTPVAATPAGDTPDLAAESGAVALLPFRDPAGQAAVLRDLLDSPQRLAAMRDRARDYARRVTWETQKEAYWRVLERARAAA